MFWRSSLGGVLLLFAVAIAPGADEKPKLTFKQDGKDLVVSLPVTVNNSSHAVWTQSSGDVKEVHLRYYVFQNRDLFVRSTKSIKIEWRLVNQKKGDQKFHVQEKFQPDTAELKTLLPILEKLKKDGENRIPRPPGCHPGCFPAGTMVQTPDGPRPIEKIRVGDAVLVIPRTGKPGSLKVASVFVTQSLLVEVETAKGRLLTTGKQPMLLSNGDLKPASDLTDKDEIVSWQDGRTRNTRVLGVKVKDMQKVYNLVLEVRSTFVANGYLAQSKPPAEK